MSNALPVYVFGEDRVPVYHRPAWEPCDDGTIRSLCGRVIWSWRGTSGGYLEDAKRLRTDWAEKIGRPCVVCHRRKV